MKTAAGKKSRLRQLMDENLQGTPVERTPEERRSRQEQYRDEMRSNTRAGFEQDEQGRYESREISHKEVFG
ncbi:MAG: hypothetical protein K0S20_520 [Patescibacteria group bacterium]|nr:hypothetical protein [Patescibacteria group bacterium]